MGKYYHKNISGDQVWQPLLGAGLLDSAGTVQNRQGPLFSKIFSTKISSKYFLSLAGLWSEGGQTQMTREGEEVACAVSARAQVSSGQTGELELCLVWDSPRVRFGGGLKEYR